MPWYVKIEKGRVAKEEFDRHVSAQRAFVRELARRGHKARSGYWAERGGGMLLFEAPSLEVARANCRRRSPGGRRLRGLRAPRVDGRRRVAPPAPEPPRA